MIARAVVAVCLALSFFASLVPLRASADAGAMACCVGKAGHCNSGLLAKHDAQPKPRPEPEPKQKPEPMCGLKPAGNDESVAVTEDKPTTEAAETSGDGITIVALDSDAAEQGATETSARVAATTTPPASVQLASLTAPCPADCRAGTTGIVRQPRPRELAVLANSSHGTSPGLANWKLRSPDTNLATSATLKRSRPRGPPPSA
jgi:hypothetical protein